MERPRMWKVLTGGLRPGGVLLVAKLSGTDSTKHSVQCYDREMLGKHWCHWALMSKLSWNFYWSFLDHSFIYLFLLVSSAQCPQSYSSRRGIPVVKEFCHCFHTFNHCWSTGVAEGRVLGSGSLGANCGSRKATLSIEGKRPVFQLL